MGWKPSVCPSSYEKRGQEATYSRVAHLALPIFRKRPVWAQGLTGGTGLVRRNPVTLWILESGQPSLCVLGAVYQVEALSAGVCHQLTVFTPLLAGGSLGFSAGCACSGRTTVLGHPADQMRRLSIYNVIDRLLSTPVSKIETDHCHAEEHFLNFFWQHCMAG